MLPEVERFLEIKRKADQEWEAWHATARQDEPRRDWNLTYESPEYRAFRAKHSVWSEKFNREYSREQEKHSQALRVARKQLRDETKDPMIIWMMDNIQDYWSYIETVLPELPATREELEDIATQHDWCTEFDSFMEQATEAGVVEPRNVAWDAEELVEWVANEYDVYPREVRREIQRRVNKIVERALAAKNNERVAKEKAPVSVS